VVDGSGVCVKNLVGGDTGGFFCELGADAAAALASDHHGRIDALEACKLVTVC